MSKLLQGHKTPSDPRGLTLKQICILNYLDNLLVLAKSERELVAHRMLLLSHLGTPWLKPAWTYTRM